MLGDKGETNEVKSSMLDINQFLHRGAFIKNSGKVLALVIHTGTDSKLIMNLGQYNYKISSAEMNINKVLTFNIVILLIGATISCLLNQKFTGNYYEKYTYIF
jgi:phospholipid-translocating ATPase